ncbi:c-type cytochrome [Thermoflavimicrobium dichotomicum]|uniref:Cytochrome c551 n=1 Tax=Thermoflavimicrobium dichotomicum TaxID=46223 RepID=A0A1I3JWB4_9BACL|nr:cytochrome c [Thermoflavimicrobium dichotomicum]SFI64456.1 cytochrome c551 [Thermoflavimicrobium dichotomicum]
MTKKWAFFAVIVSVGLLAACSQTSQSNQQTKSTNDVSLAPEETYANNCASCHGGNLEGRIGPNLEKIGGKMTKDQIVKVIKEGKGDMPGQPQISDQAREKLAEWLAGKK